jgi:hypothetical protein
MKWNRFTAVGCIVALAGSLLLARVHPFGYAGLNAQPHGRRIMDLAGIRPNAARHLLQSAQTATQPRQEFRSTAILRRSYG